MRTKLLVALSAVSIAVPVPAQVVVRQAPAGTAQPAAKAPFVKAEAEAVLRQLATKLEEDFVFPEVGKAYASLLRSKVAAGAYSKFADAEAFAAAVSSDLQAVHPDRHLRLNPPRVDGQGVRRMVRRPEDGSGVAKSGWLADGVAYIRFDLFPGNDATIADVRKFLDTHKDARTLIIDARTHRGGGLAEMDVMFPQLFDKPTVLVGMDTRVAVEQRQGNPLEDASLRKIAGPEGVVRREHFVVPAAHQTALTKAKVYLLTSRRTGSAAEHLSLSLKRTKRATLIGETTAGAGHYGGTAPLGHGYSAFIPVGRTFDPDTNQGWEGTGVKPDVEVPADKALDEALKLAGVKTTGEIALAQLR